MLGSSAIAVAPIGAFSQDAVVGVGSLSMGVNVPLPAVYQSAIAAAPICDLPYLSDQSVVVTTGANAVITSQSLALTENSIYNSDDDNIEVAGQVIQSTLNSVTLTTTVEVALDSQSLTLTENSAQAEVQPPAFTSQSMSTVLNSVGYTTDVVLEAASQTISSTLNNVQAGAGVTVYVTPLGPILYGDNWAIAATPIGSLPEPCPYIATGMHLSESSVDLNLDAVLVAASQSMLLTENSVSLITDQTVVAASQTIYTTLNGLRLWQVIPTDQPGNCPDHCDGTWVAVGIDEDIYGDDWSIAGEPIGCLPQILPPIRKYPGSAWGNVNTTTSTSWKNIQT